ncbi:MAG: type II secretion system inner membrane protein GspF [Gammaproteobacteria bacterium]|nr:type II secretion system inner membrane protein GspF [Gammaproteobacteria bacterium]
MTAFEYVALNENGSAKKGILEGDSSRHVRQLLRERGLTPVDVTVTRPNVQTGSWIQWWRRIPPMELALITRQIATMVGAGLAIEEAIQAVAQQSSSRKATSVLMTVRGNVMQGQSLSSALGEFPQTFTPMFRATVAAGEQSGYLDTVLENLADYLERSYETRRNVEMALYYPVILLVCAIAIVILVMTYVIPDIVEVFDTSGATLPAITSALITASDVLRAYGWIMLVGLIGFFTLFQFALRQASFRLGWDRFKLGVPVLRWLARATSASRYASTLAILGKSGVPLVEAMRIASEVVSNVWINSRLSEAVAKVSEGSSLRNALEATGNFPPIFLHMIASGESSGTLDELMAKAADFQQRELERRVETLVQLFRPFMLLVMAGIVLLIMLAMLLPILNMNALVL